jgi:uncharacterized protein YjbI with pentapeptide repeats
VETNLKMAKFRETDLTGTFFRQCDLTEADFRGAKNYRFNPWENQMKNARFSTPEVLSFLSPLQILID